MILDLFVSTKQCFDGQGLVVFIEDFYALDTDEKLKFMSICMSHFLHPAQVLFEIHGPT